MAGWNLPDGCRDSDIPGNSPEDEAWDAATEKAGNEWQELTDDEQAEEDEDTWIAARAEELIEEWGEAKADAQLDRQSERWEEEGRR